jgi:hypothetical protein
MYVYVSYRTLRVDSDCIVPYLTHCLFVSLMADFTM